MGFSADLSNRICNQLEGFGLDSTKFTYRVPWLADLVEEKIWFMMQWRSTTSQMIISLEGVILPPTLFIEQSNEC